MCPSPNNKPIIISFKGLSFPSPYGKGGGIINVDLSTLVNLFKP